MNYLKNKKGITLVALVITIIVLLILSGISISMITTENSVIDKASNAKIQHSIAEQKEMIAIAFVKASQKNVLGDVKQEDLQNELDKTGEKITVFSDGTNFIIQFENENRIYNLNNNGIIVSDYILDSNSLNKLATGIYGKLLENNQVEIINTVTNKISYATIWSGNIAESFASGDGSNTNPYIIETAEQLAYLAKFVNDGNTTEGKYFELRNDIMLNWDVLDDNFELNNKVLNVWTPIGYAETGTAPFFKGSLNGNNHIISGMYFLRTGNNYKGLFGNFGIINKYNSSITNLGIIDSYIRGMSVGAIVGCMNGGILTNCYFSGNIYGSHLYGIYGYARQNTEIDTLFVEGTCTKISDYASPTNSYVSSDSYTLIDFISDYMK